MNRERGDTASASRRHPRARVDIAVELFEGDIENEDLTHPGRCVDISPGGMRVMTPSDAPLGGPLQVRVDTGDGSRALPASLVWSQAHPTRGRMLGLAFLNDGAEKPLEHSLGNLVARRTWDGPVRL